MYLTKNDSSLKEFVVNDQLESAAVSELILADSDYSRFYSYQDHFRETRFMCRNFRNSLSMLSKLDDVFLKSLDYAGNPIIIYANNGNIFLSNCMKVDSIEILVSDRCFEHPPIRYKVDNKTKYFGYLNNGGVISNFAKQISCNREETKFYFIPNTQLVLAYSANVSTISNNSDANSHILSIFKNSDAIYQHLNKLFDGSKELSTNLRNPEENNNNLIYNENSYTEVKSESNLKILEKKVETFVSSIWLGIISPLGYVAFLLIVFFLILTFRTQIVKIFKFCVAKIVKKPRANEIQDIPNQNIPNQGNLNQEFPIYETTPLNNNEDNY
jgi:hypothetical protein